MHALLFTTWMFLPIAPINPVAQDTIPPVALQASFGTSGPNNLLTVGPELAVRSELRVVHPVMLRGGIELRQNETNALRQPRGTAPSVSLIGELLLYRGTRKMTGYIGAGVGYAYYFFEPFANTRDSLFAAEQVDDVQMEAALIARFMIGLRFQERFAVEVKFNDTRPRFTKTSSTESSQITISESEGTSAGNVSLTVGYIIPL